MIVHRISCFLAEPSCRISPDFSSGSIQTSYPSPDSLVRSVAGLSLANPRLWALPVILGKPLLQENKPQLHATTRMPKARKYGMHDFWFWNRLNYVGKTIGKVTVTSGAEGCERTCWEEHAHAEAKGTGYN